MTTLVIIALSLYVADDLFLDGAIIVEKIKAAIGK